MGDRISIPEKALRDIEEMTPGNNIDHLWGHDTPDEIRYDREDFLQCQEMILNQYDESYKEALPYLFPESVKV